MGVYNCKGSWALGTTCGTCKRCESTRPKELGLGDYLRNGSYQEQVRQLKLRNNTLTAQAIESEAYITKLEKINKKLCEFAEMYRQAQLNNITPENACDAEWDEVKKLLNMLANKEYVH